jgi:CRP-like cAMP-binding protein
MDLFFRVRRDWSVTDVARLVRSHECLSMLTPEEAHELVRHMHPRRVEVDTVIFEEGETDTSSMALILEGEATVESEGGGHGQRVMLGVLKEGDLIGEQGILQEVARSATVTAVTDMALATISITQFEQIMKKSPQLGCKMLMSIGRAVTTRLRDSNRRLHVMEQLNRTLQEELETASRPKIRVRDAEDTIGIGVVLPTPPLNPVSVVSMPSEIFQPQSKKPA